MAKTSQIAKLRKSQHDDSNPFVSEGQVMFVCPEEALYGHGFDFIILDDIAPLFKGCTNSLLQWYKEYLICRMNKDCKMLLVGSGPVWHGIFQRITDYGNQPWLRIYTGQKQHKELMDTVIGKNE